MGFFKKIGNAVADGINSVAGTNFSVGSSSGGSSTVNIYGYEIPSSKALIITNEIVNFRKTNGVPPTREQIESILAKHQIGTKNGGKLVDTLLNVGLDYGEQKLRDALGNPKSSGGGSIMDRLGGLGSNLIDSSLAQWFKKNWYWIVIPIPVAIGIYFIVKNGKGKKKGKKWF